jgi:hypothetical protein
MKATGRFLRHDGICRPMNVLLNHLGRSTAPRPGSTQAYCKDAPEVPRPTHRRDEYRPVIPQRVARQHCPPPLHRHAHPKTVPGSGTMNFQRMVNSVLTVCLSPGDHPSLGLTICHLGPKSGMSPPYGRSIARGEEGEALGAIVWELWSLGTLGRIASLISFAQGASCGLRHKEARQVLIYFEPCPKERLTRMAVG